LTRVLDLSEQASLSEYVTKIMELRLEKAFQRSQLQTDLARSDTSAFTVDSEFLREAEDQLGFIKTEYLELVSAARDKNQRVSATFYKTLESPRITGTSLPDKWKLILALAIALGGMIAIVVALLLPEKEANEQIAVSN